MYDANYNVITPQATRWHHSALANCVVGVLYLVTFSHIYETYISPTWGYTGLVYRPLTYTEFLFQVVLVAITSFFLPPRIDKPSGLIIWLLYAFVFMPTTAMTFMIGFNTSSFYASGLVALAASVIVCSIVSTKSPVPSVVSENISEAFTNLMLFGFIVVALVLFVVYRDILSFAAIDDVYTQRFAASDLDSGALVGYFRTYFTYVFSPALIAIGITLKRKRWMILAGVGGYIFSYLIDASKISLVIPLAILVFSLMKSRGLESTAFFTVGIAILAAVASLFTEYSSLIRFIVDLVLLRSIAIPGQTFSQYYDLFYNRGYTYWSNTKIINLVIPPPGDFKLDPMWPNLGTIVGAEFYGADSRMNANANLFVGEGIAAAGPIGVLVIGLVLAYWLRSLDNFSQKWPATISMTVMVPIGLGLTNVHLTTLLLSFGGLFWLVAFKTGLAKRKRL
ncbi:hypothetical protein GGR88_001648 [Sphingomonas jejuensis]|uniref:Oligosaccharide repeat unit polymerase n=1 Tax=Sphingomonas jejuensis TaxID=904715 RepID=A0ABX0XLR6_9SPHN|nr:hypothetical protein [Sphingomonas jejuensis]